MRGTESFINLADGLNAVKNMRVRKQGPLWSQLQDIVVSWANGTKRPGCPRCPKRLALQDVLLEPFHGPFAGLFII